MKGVKRIKEPRGEEGEKGNGTHGSRSFFLRLEHAHFDAIQQQQIDFDFSTTKTRSFRCTSAAAGIL